MFCCTYCMFCCTYCVSSRCNSVIASVIFTILFDFKGNKATGPDNVPAWILKSHANILAGPLTAIFNSSLREGIIPGTWKSANVIPVPNPPNTIEKYVRPISLTPIASKHWSQ